MTANFNENLPGCEYQLSSMIQGTSKRIESRGDKTSRSRRSQKIKDKKILNKREIVKYLMQWKEFIAEHDSWEREKDLENAKEMVANIVI